MKRTRLLFILKWFYLITNSRYRSKNFRTALGNCHTATVHHVTPLLDSLIHACALTRHSLGSHSTWLRKTPYPNHLTHTNNNSETTHVRIAYKLAQSQPQPCRKYGHTPLTTNFIQKRFSPIQPSNNGVQTVAVPVIPILHTYRAIFCTKVLEVRQNCRKFVLSPLSL